MVKIIRQGVYYMEGRLVKEAQAFMTSEKKARAVQNTMTHAVLSAHGGGRIALAGDIVALLRALDDLGIASLPPAVFFSGSDDTAFLRSAAERFRARLVPLDLCAPQQYLREAFAEGGEVLLTDLPLPCGALGALALPCGEGGILRYAACGALPKEAETVAVLLRGTPADGVGPTDIALAIRKELLYFHDFGRGKILEFFGTGLNMLSMDFRCAISDALKGDCLSTLWATDGRTREYFLRHGREGYAPLAPVEPAYYSGGITLDLSRIAPMIGLGDHILSLQAALEDPSAALAMAEAAIRARGGSHPLPKGEKLRLVYGEVGGYAGTFETVAECAEILKERRISPAGGMISCISAPVARAAMERGYAAQLIDAGMCFERMSAWPTQGFFAFDGDMEAPIVLDARTIAASLAEGELVPATQAEYARCREGETFSDACYRHRVFFGNGSASALDYGAVRPIPAFAPVPDEVTLQVLEEPTGDGAFAVLHTAEAYAWGDAIAWRERGAVAAIALSYSEKNRTHLIDWGILPLTAKRLPEAGTVLRITNIHAALAGGELRAVRLTSRSEKPFSLSLEIREGEREVLLAGSKNALIKAGRKQQ